MTIPIHKGVHLRHVLSALRELSDKDVQQRLWLSTRSPGSFSETCCELFDDSGLSHELERGFRAERGGVRDFVPQPVFDEQLDRTLGELSKLLDKVDHSGSLEDFIESREMAEVRCKAAELLQSLQAFLGRGG
jgi:hypothetical protein